MFLSFVEKRETEAPLVIQKNIGKAILWKNRKILECKPAVEFSSGLYSRYATDEAFSCIGFNHYFCLLRENAHSHAVFPGSVKKGMEEL